MTDAFAFAFYVCVRVQAVAIYWATSTGYTLAQNIVLGYLDRRRSSSRSIPQN